MCGIAGLVVDSPREAPGEALCRAMCAQIVHRGPDDEGIFRDRRALLGMRRLSIIDLATGHQPVHNEERTVHAVFNGEIYNYRALRAELESLGHRFYTSSDSETIVHAYEQWGEGFAARLDGMFAIALWDSRAERLVLARDRFGKKPLYVWRHDGTLAFASELKSLRVLPGFPRELDRDAIASYVAFGYVPTAQCAFRGVEKLPPAHYLVHERGRSRVERYWEIALEPKLALGEEEAKEQLAALLDEAVRCRLMSDVPFGAFLSGGLDSSVVVALMARHMSQPVKTFSIGFREARYNELPDARRVAQHIGTDHHELVVEPDAVALLERLVWHLDEPFADSSAIPTYLVSELAARHVKMVLTGDGGDEAFAGYDRYLRTLALERLGALKPAAAAALGIAGRVLPGARGFRLRRIGARLGMPFEQSYLASVALTRPELARELLRDPGGDPYAALSPLFARSAALAPLDRMIAVDLGSYLVDDILVKVDRTTMAASLEARAPLLDHRLVEFAVRLPESMRVRNGRGKHLLREVARRWLPSDVLDKPKQGFAIPLAAWFRGPLRELAADTFESRAFRERGLLRDDTVRRCLASHLSGQADHAEPLWLALCLELWAQRFVDAPGESDSAQPLPLALQA
ncbi:MAG TPA: asparagine synthase (glutamine-hydrolyzing) [Xanthomonadales bacterium]|nr:asparagine synthase (glutamine-hydrolyzing) [Xanthomonadales bacterium]